MSLQARPSRVVLGVGAVWLVLVCLPLVLNRTMGLPPTWTMSGALFAAVVSAAVLPPHVLPRATRTRTHSRPRVDSCASWTTPLHPTVAAQRIESAFAHDAHVRRVDATSLEIAAGSDADFRRWGVFLARGRAALPAVVTVSVVSEGTGARVSARGRDELGWYAGPPGKRVERSARQTLDHLMARILEASPPAATTSTTDV